MVADGNKNPSFSSLAVKSQISLMGTNSVIKVGSAVVVIVSISVACVDVSRAVCLILGGDGIVLLRLVVSLSTSVCFP
jgi:hypothetical protein